MIFGKVDINETVQWSKWSWVQFMDFYEHSLKGKVIETPEEIAKVLGVKLPDKSKVKTKNSE
jgi:hypothetical protein